VNENRQTNGSCHTSPLSALLIDAPVGRHFAQLHRRSETLTGAVGQFVETGLRRGNGVVVIASALHTEEVFDRLAEERIDVGSFLRCGQLVVRDAQAMLDTIMRGGTPDEGAFRRAIASVLESVHAFGRPAPRAYGEMVNLLWRAGQTAAALRLEGFWNELARLYPFGLFCGYMLDSRDVSIHAGRLHETGRPLGDVVAAPHDQVFREALNQASHDVFGLPLCRLVGLPSPVPPGSPLPPPDQRTMLWMMRQAPASSAEVLEQARVQYQQRFN
jgi:hypothetical protein